MRLHRRIRVEYFPEVLIAGSEDIQDVGIEVLGPRVVIAPGDDQDRGLMLEGGLVRTPAPKRVVLVDEIHDSSLDRDPLPDQPEGITAPVPPFMVGGGELPGGTQ